MMEIGPITTTIINLVTGRVSTVVGGKTLIVGCDQSSGWEEICQRRSEQKKSGNRL